MTHRPLFAAILLTAGVASAQPSPEARLAAVRDAVATVLPSVVQIQTVGGLDPTGGHLPSSGPTTGVVVSNEGHIVSSLFNFAENPTSILVKLPSGQHAPATLVARDTSRMLALLKIETDRPTTPALAYPIEDARPGMSVIAVGRSYQDEQADVSVGIVSALSRMHGRVLQTDANVSPANYGGPLVDLRGRVLGVLVPMSPSGGSELAGVEFYDSGIGFAVPLVHVYAVLDRWKTGEDLRPGRLGVGLAKGNEIVAPPVIAVVAPNSPASDAGLEPGDRITAVDGETVETQGQFRGKLGPLYADDELSLSYSRSESRHEVSLTLVAEIAPAVPDAAPETPSEQ